MKCGENVQRKEVMMSVKTMKKRSQFLAAQKGVKRHSSAFTLLAYDRRDGNDEINVGFTCSKRVGNAVERNRAKRRLREAARACIPGLGQPGWDYVLIGKLVGDAEVPFQDMIRDLRGLLNDLTPAISNEL